MNTIKFCPIYLTELVDTDFDMEYFVKYDLSLPFEQKVHVCGV